MASSTSSEAASESVINLHKFSIELYCTVLYCTVLYCNVINLHKFSTEKSPDSSAQVINPFYIEKISMGEIATKSGGSEI